MRIAIVGAGVSGLTAAHYLSRGSSDGSSTDQSHDVTLFEANDYPGGHTDTHNVFVDGRSVNVDSGFIVFNEHNYPNFTRLLNQLDVRWQDSDMSFSAVNERTGMEYGADGFKRLFAQKRNLVNPKFYRMLWDLLRFYREAPALRHPSDNPLTLGEYLTREKYSSVFIDNHILPMACALWSASADTIVEFPLHYFVSFMHNHRMLQISDRPQWKTITGGSNTYVTRLLSTFNGNLRVSCPVNSVSRTRNGVLIHSKKFGSEHFDKVVFACHSDQALRLLTDPTIAESRILGAIPYQENQAVLHTDQSYLPSNRDAWASWNARIPKQASDRCTVSYWMNSLQNLDCSTPLIVTLNPSASGENAIATDKILAIRTYHHPVFNHDTLWAQQQRSQINDQNNTFYCGAYWGWGFHEDGVRSALDVVAQMTQGAAYAVAS